MLVYRRVSILLIISPRQRIQEAPGVPFHYFDVNRPVEIGDFCHWFLRNTFLVENSRRDSNLIHDPLYGIST